MMKTFSEGGVNPITIVDERGDNQAAGLAAGGGVFVIILFLLVIAVVLIPFISRRNEPVVAQGSALSEILPAILVAQGINGGGSLAKQTVDISTMNGNGYGPSNFDLYRQGSLNGENSLMQFCQTRELIWQDGQSTRDNQNAIAMQALRDENHNLREQVTRETILNRIDQSNTAQTFRIEDVYNSLRREISTLGAQLPRNPIPAVAVSPFGAYNPPGYAV